MLLLSLMACLFLQAEPWKRQGKVDGFEVYTRSEPGTKIRGVRAVGEINVDVPNFMALLRDIRRSNDWTPDQIEKKLVENVSESEAVTYSITAMPWPLDDRDMVVHNKLMFDEEKNLLYIKSKSVTHPKFPKKKKYERALLTYGNLGFRPVSPTRTLIDFTIFADPAGSIPSWVINYFQKKWPSRFLRSLEKYANANRLKLSSDLRNMVERQLEHMELPADYYDNLTKQAHHQ